MKLCDEDKRKITVRLQQLLLKNFPYCTESTCQFYKTCHDIERCVLACFMRLVKENGEQNENNEGMDSK